MPLAYKLHKMFNERKRFRFPFNQNKNEIPKNGVYLIFEEGEYFENFDRIVRIGTHTGNNQLCARLEQHFLKPNKNRSIFRKNIGRCILNREKSDYLSLWDLDITSRIDKEKNLPLLNLDFEKIIESKISNYIQNNLSFCVFEVNEKEDRLFWESKIISTLYKSNQLIPTKSWLGNYSTKYKITESGLWQVNNLNGSELTMEELKVLEQILLKK